MWGFKQDGQFQFGYVDASLSIIKMEEIEEVKNISFEFIGSDELDEIQGYGSLKIIQNSHIEGIFNFFQSDSYTFTAKKIKLN